MKYMIVAVVLLYAVSSFGFSLTINRSPFMNLVKLSELSRRGTTKTESEIESYLNILRDSITVKGVFVSEGSPGSSVAILVGPSGVPLIVKRGKRIRKNVVVYSIGKNFVVLHVSVGEGRKWVPLKLYLKR